jgi:hypothetical protein
LKIYYSNRNERNAHQDYYLLSILAKVKEDLLVLSNDEGGGGRRHFMVGYVPDAYILKM